MAFLGVCLEMILIGDSVSCSLPDGLIYMLSVNGQRYNGRVLKKLDNGIEG